MLPWIRHTVEGWEYPQLGLWCVNVCFLIVYNLKLRAKKLLAANSPKCQYSQRLSKHIFIYLFISNIMVIFRKHWECDIAFIKQVNKLEINIVELIFTHNIANNLVCLPPIKSNLPSKSQHNTYLHVSEQQSGWRTTGELGSLNKTWAPLKTWFVKFFGGSQKYW